jgi:hypothetical protein
MLERVYEGTIVTCWNLLLLTMEKHVLGPLGITVSSYLSVDYDIDHMTSINIIVTGKRRLIAGSRVTSIMIKELNHWNTYCLTSGYHHIVKQSDVTKVLTL